MNKMRKLRKYKTEKRPFRTIASWTILATKSIKFITPLLLIITLGFNQISKEYTKYLLSIIYRCQNKKLKVWKGKAVWWDRIRAIFLKKATIVLLSWLCSPGKARKLLRKKFKHNLNLKRNSDFIWKSLISIISIYIKFILINYILLN